MTADEFAGVRVYMQGRQQLQRDARAAGRSFRELGDDIHHTTQRTWLMNQAMFTLRRLVYGATLAVGALVTATAALGIRFNLTMETSRVAFGTLLGSVDEANKEIEFLYDLAARTPFEFNTLATAARQFLGWGFSIEEVNRHLTTLSDVIAAMGGDTQGIEHVIRAFGQMRSAGVVRMQDLMQLQQAIPGVMRILQEQLQLSPRIMANIGAFRIDANKAIEAIMQGISTDPRFEGAAEALEATATGRLTTFRDLFGRIMGTILLAPFERFSDSLGRVNDALRELTTIRTTQGFGPMIAAIDEMIGAGGNLVRVWNLISGLGRNSAAFFRNVLAPALTDTAQVVGMVLYPTLLLLSSVLGALAEHSTLARIMVTMLTAAYVAQKIILIKTAIATRVLIILKRRELALSRSAVLLMVTAARLQNLWTAATLGYVRSANGQFIAMTRVQRMARRLVLAMGAAKRATIAFAIAVRGATAAMITFLLTNPVGWAILVAAALVFLYWKWDWFRKKVNQVFFWIKDHWPLLAVVILAPFLVPILTAIKMFQLLKDKAGAIFDWIRDKFTWLGKIFSWIPGLGGGWNPTAELAMATSGFSGTSTFSGGAPEVQWSPRRTSVTPLEKPNLGVDFGPLKATAPIVVKIGKRTVAEANAEIVLAREARQ